MLQKKIKAEGMTISDYNLHFKAVIIRQNGIGTNADT